MKDYVPVSIILFYFQIKADAGVGVACNLVCHVIIIPGRQVDVTEADGVEGIVITFHSDYDTASITSISHTQYRFNNLCYKPAIG